MRFLAFLIVAGVILSVAKALTFVLILLIALSLIWAVLTKPYELAAFVILTALCEIVTAHPLVALLAGFTLAALIVCRQLDSIESNTSSDAKSPTRD